MTDLEIIESRHSVRSFLDKEIEAEKLQQLENEISSINEESGLHFQLFANEPEAFMANKSHYGEFRNCRNYFALVGPKNAESAIGYYGERLVLFAQKLGLNTCWVALTYRKSHVNINADKGEKFYVVIALGYGENQGVAHKSKTASEVSDITGDAPEWFSKGVEAALLAPTAMNQQKFVLRYSDGRVEAREKPAMYSKLDLGIVKYHFELGAGKDGSIWL